jgi:transmembrane sensor
MIPGNHLNVNTRKSGGGIEVALVDGSLQVYFNNQREDPEILTPGEKAEFNPSERTISVSQSDNPNFLAWKTRRLIFTNDRLDYIIANLNNVYASSILVGDDALAGCTLTATFDNQSLESVLNVISATLDLDVQSSSSGIVLTGKGCKPE